ncbi:MAG: M23 family metallopeptidase [Syntrophaceae bacterium]
MKNAGAKFLWFIVLLGLACAIGAVFLFLEWEKPRIVADPSLSVIGQHKVADIDFMDLQSGLRHIAVRLSQGGKDIVLASADMDGKGVTQKTLRVEVSPRDLGLTDGEALLTITATDFSPLKNTSTLTIKTTIDAVAPRIALLSTAHNVNPGGTCLAIFKLSKAVKTCGVRVGTDFFPAYATKIKDKPCYVCYFAVPMDVKATTPMAIVVEDKGGNTATAAIPFHIRTGQTFRADKLTLSARFLQNKAVEFEQHDRHLAGKSPEEIFIAVNSQTRQENTKKIQSYCARSQPKQLWQGTFLRMQNSAPMARFGDKRTYLYEGQDLGGSVHLGVDLASTAHAPLEAANNGVVVFAEYLGIYGNTVIIDHGMGVASLYGHMNEIAVKPGQQVSKGTVIGTTGTTGLAGGDHLHFSILVGGRFVNPIEWWDPHWLKDNVEDKLNDAAM